MTANTEVSYMMCCIVGNIPDYITFAFAFGSTSLLCFLFAIRNMLKARDMLGDPWGALINRIIVQCKWAGTLLL